jgi:hypothetical protein
MLNVHVKVACLCPDCNVISKLHGHVHAASTFPCCMYIFQAECPCLRWVSMSPCCMNVLQGHRYMNIDTDTGTDTGKDMGTAWTQTWTWTRNGHGHGHGNGHGDRQGHEYGHQTTLSVKRTSFYVPWRIYQRRKSLFEAKLRSGQYAVRHINLRFDLFAERRRNLRSDLSAEKS